MQHDRQDSLSSMSQKVKKKKKQELIPLSLQDPLAWLPSLRASVDFQTGTEDATSSC